MPLRIDPALAIVWRNTHQLQFGAPEARVILDSPDRVQLDLVKLLRRGASRATLETIATAIGGGPADVAAVLTTLEPVLVETGTAPAASGARRPAGAPTGATEPSGPIVVTGRDRTATTIGGLLGVLGYRVVGVPPEAPLHLDETPSLVVLIAERVVDPGLHLPLLRRDLPHLPIVYGDGDAVVGPFVVPGASACLRCVDLERHDADEAWPRIAPQLAVHPAAPRTPRLELLSALTAARAIDARFLGHPTALDDVALVIPPDGSPPRRVPCAPHPACGCGALPGTATAPDPLATHRPGVPSSAPVDDALG